MSARPEQLSRQAPRSDVVVQYLYVHDPSEQFDYPQSRTGKTLAGALERLAFHDLTGLAQRIWTGPRHGAPPVADPASLCRWHLPSEKVLSLRRAAQAVMSGRSAALARDLRDPNAAMRRFNVAGAGWSRRVRDDGRIATHPLSQAARSRLGGAVRSRPDRSVR